MIKRKINDTNYSPEFKVSVIMDIREHGLGYRETMRKYGISGHSTVQKWVRIYLAEGVAGLMAERRGYGTKGKPKKEPPEEEIENDLKAENKRLKERNLYLEAELAYLKKLDALVRAEEQQNGRKPK